MFCSFWSADNLGDFPGILQNIAQKCQGTKCTEHASKKVRPLRTLELYIFCTVIPIAMQNVSYPLFAYLRSFRKGLADRGGWCQEVLPMPPFYYAPLGEEGHISGEMFVCFWSEESNRPLTPILFGKVSRYTSHFYRDTFAKVCPPLGRK